MHKCVRCGRAATSLQEINDGCPCGSKVFVFNKDAVDASIAGENIAPKIPKEDMAVAPEPDGNGVRTEAQGGVLEMSGKPSERGAGGNGKGVDADGAGRDGKPADGGGANGKAPESYHARMAFSTEDVENIKVLTEGVFALELHSLYKDPVVLKDEEGIYYVKIPLEQNETALRKLGLDGKADGNGKGKAKKEEKKD